MLISIMHGPIAEKLHGKVQNVAFFNLTCSGNVRDILNVIFIGLLLGVLGCSDISMNILIQWGLQA